MGSTKEGMVYTLPTTLDYSNNHDFIALARKVFFLEKLYKSKKGKKTLYKLVFYLFFHSINPLLLFEIHCLNVLN